MVTLADTIILFLFVAAVRLVPLPLDGRPNPALPRYKGPLEQAAAEAQLPDEDVMLLTAQGLSYRDAVAALLLAGGDVDQAVVTAMEMMDSGGCAEVWMMTMDHVQQQQAGPSNLLEVMEQREVGY